MGSNFQVVATASLFGLQVVAPVPELTLQVCPPLQLAENVPGALLHAARSTHDANMMRRIVERAAGLDRDARVGVSSLQCAPAMFNRKKMRFFGSVDLPKYPLRACSAN
jgi:hypothetical protein